MLRYCILISVSLIITSCASKEEVKPLPCIPVPCKVQEVHNVTRIPKIPSVEVHVNADGGYDEEDRYRVEKLIKMLRISEDYYYSNLPKN